MATFWSRWISLPHIHTHLTSHHHVLWIDLCYRVCLSSCNTNPQVIYHYQTKLLQQCSLRAAIMLLQCPQLVQQALFYTLKCQDPLRELFLETWDTCNPPYCPKVEAPTVMRTIMLSLEVFASHGNCLTLSYGIAGPVITPVLLMLCVFIPSGSSLVSIRLLCCLYRHTVIHTQKHRSANGIFSQNTGPSF